LSSNFQQTFISKRIWRTLNNVYCLVVFLSVVFVKFISKTKQTWMGFAFCDASLSPCFLKKMEGIFFLAPTGCLSIRHVTLFPPKWLFRNSPNFVVMITTWQERVITVSFLSPYPRAGSKGKIPKKFNYGHIFKHFRMMHIHA